jgi:hypothetical protein
MCVLAKGSAAVRLANTGVDGPKCNAVLRTGAVR